MDREKDSVVKYVQFILTIYCDVIFCERRSEISLHRCTGNSTMDKETSLNERTACLSGKFLKDFHFSVFNIV